LVPGWMPGLSSIDIGNAGSAIGGTVYGPSGAPLAGAKVQLRIEQLPSTLAITAADGSFSLLARPLPAVMNPLIAVDVTPPAGSGLPRLLAQSTTVFDLQNQLQIHYLSTLALRDLQGAKIQRTTLQGTAPVA